MLNFIGNYEVYGSNYPVYTFEWAADGMQDSVNDTLLLHESDYIRLLLYCVLNI